MPAGIKKQLATILSVQVLSSFASPDFSGFAYINFMLWVSKVPAKRPAAMQAWRVA